MTDPHGHTRGQVRERCTGGVSKTDGAIQALLQDNQFGPVELFDSAT